jgi:RimJ/RimL family protein N-acetyltransferase
MTEDDSPAVIHGDGVVLLPVRPEDADAVLAGVFPTDPPWPPGLHAGRGWPHEDTPHAFALLAAGSRTWVVVTDAGVVGELGTKGPPDATGAVEIGYGLAAPARGRGLGTAAVRALVEHLLGRPDVTAVDAEVDVDNVASRRLLERLGFVVVDVESERLRLRRTAAI